MENNMKFVSLWLSLLCVLVFLLQIFFPGFTETFYLSENALTRPWQFVTAIFLHGSVIHLLYNLFALFLFGLILEKLIGSKRLFWLFLLSGIFANVISFYWFPNALGASGAIMAIIGALAIVRPMMAMFAFGMILPMFFVAIIWVIGSILGIFGFGDQGTGHLAHLSGIFIGILYGLFLRLRYKERKESRLMYQKKIILPESYMRSWEDAYMKR
jgi:membrane associated rhomboid family serine protease